MSCCLDPVNMCCWNHGVDITQADYIEGVCFIGAAEEEESEEPDDSDEFLESQKGKKK